jgi:hypothetical protein
MSFGYDRLSVQRYVLVRYFSSNTEIYPDLSQNIPRNLIFIA